MEKRGSMSDIVVKPLNAKEKKWIERAQKLFMAAPDRFDFLTTGDRDFTVIDAEGAKISELYDGAHERDGLDLGTIVTKGFFHGVTG